MTSHTHRGRPGGDVILTGGGRVVTSHRRGASCPTQRQPLPKVATVEFYGAAAHPNTPENGTPAEGLLIGGTDGGSISSHQPRLVPRRVRHHHHHHRGRRHRPPASGGYIFRDARLDAIAAEGTERVGTLAAGPRLHCAVSLTPTLPRAATCEPALLVEKWYV